MSSRGWQLRIADTESAAHRVLNRLSGLSLETFTQDIELMEWTAFQFIVIGEASNAIPVEVREQFAAIP